MKRLLLLGITMFAFAACTQNEVQELTHNRAAVPDTITVGFEDGEDATRIQLNEAQKTVWNAGDEVSVFYQSHTNMKWVFQGEDGDRSGLLKAEGGNPGEQVMDDVVIVYPYNGDYTLNLEDKSVIAMLPNVQSYKQGSYGEGGNIMVAASDLSAFTLRSVCGWLKVQLTGDGERVTSITLRGNGGEQLAGVVYVDAKSAKATLPGEGGGHDDVENGIGDDLDFADSIFTEVTLDCGEGVVLGAEATAFYIAVLPQSLKEGFTVNVECEGHKPMTLETTTATTIERNHIKSMKSIKFEVGENTGSTDSDVANKEIRYTATAKIEANSYNPWIFETFGANIVAHEWDATTGEGVITFDGNVTTIGDYAFYYCDSLTSVNIPDSVVWIGEEAFFECYSLKSVTIGDGVTTIGDYAFCDCNGLTSVTIGDGVTTIGEDAFAWCISLTSVTIPDSVTTIGNAAFYHCESMTSVTICDGVTTIGEEAFHCCYCLTSITIPDSVTSIGNSAFKDCDSLTSITIPDSVTTIGEEAFAWCISLTSVTICDGVTTIGEEAFRSCDSLKSVTICDGVTTIGEYAFCDCDSLTSITIPDSVTTIGESAFQNCDSLTSVNIGDGVTTIGEGAFCDCDSLTEFNGKFASKDGRCLIVDGVLNSFAPYGLTEYTIPDSVTMIGEYAFADCISLTSVTIPDSVTTIGEGAFEDCDSLTSITIPNSVTTIGEYAFYDCYGLTSITIPDSVTTIGEEAFFNCDSLTSVTIGDSVTTIGYEAFAYCTNLTSVYCKATIPPSLDGSWVFDDNLRGRKIYVPTGSVNAYKSDWKWYASIIVGYDF